MIMMKVGSTGQTRAYPDERKLGNQCYQPRYLLSGVHSERDAAGKDGHANNARKSKDGVDLMIDGR